MDSTRKKQITRGYKRGAELCVVDTLDHGTLKECHLIICERYKDLNLPAPDWITISKAFTLSTVKDKAQCFALKYNGIIIGTRMVLCHNKRVYDWYAASRKEFYNLYPNDILPWEVFKWSKENGFQLFDFGGAGKPNVPYGVREYKLKFGGDVVNYGRYRLVHSQMLYSAAVAGFTLLQKVRHSTSQA